MIACLKGFCRGAIAVAAIGLGLLGSASAASALGSFQITQPVPNSYTNQTRPTAVWTTSTGATAYQVVLSFGVNCQNPFYTSTWISTTSLQLPSLGQSWYYLCVTARDTANATLGASNTGMSFNVDLTPPLPPIISSLPNPVTTRLPTITWTKTSGTEYGSTTYVYTLKIGTAAGCASPLQSYSVTSGTSPVSQTLATPLGDGNFYVCLSAQDQAGNVTPATNNNLAFTVAAPIDPFSVTAPPTYVNSTTPTVAWTAALGATSYEVSVGGTYDCPNPIARVTNITGTSVVLPPIPQGSYDLCVRAKNGRGDVASPTGGDQLLYVDLTPPVDFTINAPSALTNNNRPTVTWTRAAQSEFGSPNYTYTLAVGTAAGCASPLQTFTLSSATSPVSQTLTSALADGNYVLCLSARDLAGNTKNATNNNYAFTVDATPPASFSVNPVASPSSNSRPTVSWGAATGASTYTLAIGANTSCSPAVQTYPSLTSLSLTASTALPDATYYACVTAYDGAGNSRSAISNAFTVDTTPPSAFTISTPASTYVTSRTFTTGWTTATGASSYDYWLATAPGCPGTPGNQTATSRQFTVTSDGTYYFCVRARDAAGNLRTATNSGRSVIVDTVPPGPVTLNQGADATNRSAYSISWNATNPSGESLTFEIQKSRGATCTENPTIEIVTSSTTANQRTINLDQGSGPYLVCVVAVDAAGNRTSSNPISTRSSIPIGRQDMAIVAVRSPDQGTLPTDADLASRFAGPISDRFREISFDQFWINPVVFDIQLPACDNPTPTQVLQALTSAGQRAYDFDHIVVLRNCQGAFSAQFEFSDPQRAVPLYGLFAAFFGFVDVSENSGVLIQEVMHGFGLYFHASRWVCTGASLYAVGCTSDEYGNEFDSMGSSDASVNINAYYKDVAGWLPPSRVQTITQSGRYTIRPYDSTSGVVAAKIQNPAWPAAQPQYYVEFRKNAVGADARMALSNFTSNTQGLMLNTGYFATSATGTNSKTWLVDLSPANNADRVTLNPGSGTYTDPVRGVTVTAVGLDGNGDMMFDVGFSSFDCQAQFGPNFEVKDPGRFSDPNISPLTAGVPMVMAGIGAVYEISNPACLPSGQTYSVRIVPPSGWTSTPATVTAVGWDWNTVGSASPTLTAPTGTAPGLYTVTLEVRNTTTGSVATSSPFSVRVR